MDRLAKHRRRRSAKDCERRWKSALQDQESPNIHNGTYGLSDLELFNVLADQLKPLVMLFYRPNNDH